MSQIIKKENIVVSIREYTDNNGQPKKVYKTIGELVTMQGGDGSTYQFGEMWGPTGAQKFNIYDQQERETKNGANNTQSGQQGNQQNFDQKPPF